MSSYSNTILQRGNAVYCTRTHEAKPQESKWIRMMEYQEKTHTAWCQDTTVKNTSASHRHNCGMRSYRLHKHLLSQPLPRQSRGGGKQHPTSSFHPLLPPRCMYQGSQYEGHGQHVPWPADPSSLFTLAWLQENHHTDLQLHKDQ